AVSVASGASLSLPSDGTALKVIKTGPVSIAGTGKIDLSDNKVITTTPVGSATGGVYDGISGYLQSGRNGGDWSGAGIVTSQTGATASILNSIGVATAQQAKGLTNPTDTT